jgi:hypothetical protein
MLRSAFFVTLSLLPGLASEATAQRKPRPDTLGAQPEAAVTIAGKIGGKRYLASGPGSCRSAADASIRGLSASLWMVEYDGARDGALKHLSLTLWRPKDGSPDQLSLAVETSSGSHRIDTGTPGDVKGEASVTILPSGPGGRLEIAGKEAGGKPVQLTIECPAFAEVEAEGG